jgi:putative protease
MRYIELLSPAKNLDCGIEAINHGADAVYIGAPKFSARAAVGNSIDDIEKLVKYAHKFNAKVYAALNTILKDDELEEARTAIWDLYNAGADAIIIQDMGILQLDIPPIALHASTQMDNRTVEKLRFLEQAGFSQAVLARELSLKQIKEITSQVKIPIEVFVHGALCVSYSGQCYISQAIGGRSANRGECAQFCRLPYDLKDAFGKTIVKNKHLLSLKDLNLSEYLEDLISAGVSSFKIEGRLKDISYVKNITAFYRQKLDKILKSPSGDLGVTYFFQPDVKKTFQRGGTSYFLKERNAEITSFDTPKSKGEFVGNVIETRKDFFTIDARTEIKNGDGLCFIDKNGVFCGFRVNRVEGKNIFPAQMPGLEKQTSLYRNYDHEFLQTLAKKSAERKIAVDIFIKEKNDNIELTITDEDKNRIIQQHSFEKTIAKEPEKAFENIKKQFSKLGGSDFYLNKIDIQFNEAYFIPNSILSEWRRLLIEALSELREKNYKFFRKEIKPTKHSYPQKELTYLGNVFNEKAKEFYIQHGVTNIEPAFEKEQIRNVPVMFCKHCLKYSLGFCSKYSNKKTAHSFKEPFFLSYKNELLELKFNCRDCEMQVIKK